MSVPSYYIVASPPDTPVDLPVSWDPTSNPYAVSREQMQLTTGRGITFEYELFHRRTPIYVFTVSASQLAAFKTMHDAVVGEPFYFMPDDSSPLDVIHCRKEPSFLPESLGVFIADGVAEQWFRYELRLFEEITAADIQD